MQTILKSQNELCYLIFKLRERLTKSETVTRRDGLPIHRGRGHKLKIKDIIKRTSSLHSQKSQTYGSGSAPQIQMTRRECLRQEINKRRSI